MSNWRNPFIKKFSELNIPYYNPQKPVGQWNPEDAIEEAINLANDKIILFPVTSETYAFGSLAESGFALIPTINCNRHRYVVTLIAQNLDPALEEDKERAEESIRARKLVMEHLQQLNMDNIFIVNTLDEMLAVCLKLYEMIKIGEELKKYNSRRLHEPIKLAIST